MEDNQMIINRYEKYLKYNKRLNETTIKNYLCDLKAFDVYLEKHFYETKKEDIENYIKDKQMKGIGSSRINFSICVLSSFYKYLLRNHHINANPIEDVKRPSVKKKEKEEGLSHNKIYQIRKQLKEHGNLQLEVFFSLLVCSGCRKNYIDKINWRFIKWKEKYIEVIINDTERAILYLDDYTLDLLAQLRKERHKKHIKQKWVFITRHNGHWNSVTSRTITYWINRVANICELDKLNFNITKQTAIRYWKIRRFSDEKIEKILSHQKFEIEFRSIILDEIKNLNNL